MVENVGEGAIEGLSYDRLLNHICADRDEEEEEEDSAPAVDSGRGLRRVESGSWETPISSLSDAQCAENGERKLPVD